MAWSKPKRTRDQLPPEGETIAEIVDMQQKQSKRSGRNMVEMTVIVEHQGKAYRIKDWFVAGVEFTAAKVEALRIALGKDKEGFRLSQQIGARFYAKIGHREPQGEYGWSAEIVEFMEPGPSGPPEANYYRPPEDPSTIPY
jgi:hypothetical protein